jgi:hypothetical protein
MPTTLPRRMAAIPSVATCAAAICNGRLTSIPAGRNAPIAVTTKRCSEGVKSALCGPKIGSMNGREARGSHRLTRRLRRCDRLLSVARKVIPHLEDRPH